MAQLPPVSRFMDTVVPTLTADMDILAATDVLVREHVTGAPVVDDTMAVIGILTEKDCLRLLTLGTDSADEPVGTVGDFMVRDVITVRPDVNIYYAAGLFLAHSFRRLPVVQGNRLVGAITRYDILRAVSANHKLVIGG